MRAQKFLPLKGIQALHESEMALTFKGLWLVLSGGACLGYFSVAVVKPHGQYNSDKKVSNLAYCFRVLESIMQRGSWKLTSGSTAMRQIKSTGNLTVWAHRCESLSP